MRRHVVAGRRLIVVAALAAAALGASAAMSGPRPSSIYFWSDRGHPLLYSMRPDGSSVRLVYRTPQNAKRPVPSPDGRWIAFDGAEPGKPPMSDFDVQLVRSNGTGRRTIAGTRAYELDAQWSPDGLRLSYSRQPTRDWRRSWIWVARRDGRGARRVTRGQFARWSPDGSMLVVDSPGEGNDGDLVIVDLGGRVISRFPASPELEQPAAWSPDGSRILFTRFRADGAGADVFVVSVDGSGERRLTSARGEDVAAAWSPDGRSVLFTSDRTGREQVFLMNTDGSNERNISRSRFDEVATSWR